MPTHFTHTRLLVPADQFVATYRFYRDTVGLIPRFNGEKSVYAEFEAGDPMTSGHALALYRSDLMAAVVGTGETRPAGSADRVVVCLGIDDVDQAAADLTSKGVIFITQPHDQPSWMIRVAHFRDPAGHLVEISAPLLIA